MSTSQLSIQLLYWNEHEGIIGKYMGVGESYPFSLAWYCPKRQAYILHPQFKDKDIYDKDSKGRFQKVWNPWWYTSKAAYEKKHPGWSNYYKVVIVCMDEGKEDEEPIDLEFRFRGIDDLIHYIYSTDIFPVNSLGNVKVGFYRPGRRNSGQYYLHMTEEYYI